MNRDCTTDEKRTLESLIDSTSLQSVLEALCEICEEKADHIQASYAVDARVDPLARAWRTAAGVCGVAVCEKAVAQISQ